MGIDNREIKAMVEMWMWSCGCDLYFLVGLFVPFAFFEYCEPP